MFFCRFDLSLGCDYAEVAPNLRDGLKVEDMLSPFNPSTDRTTLHLHLFPVPGFLLLLR